MKRSVIILLSILFFNSPYIKAQDDFETKLLNQFHKITSEEMMSWVETLCSTEFNGRLSGTPEYTASAEWVASKLKEWGVKPAGDNGSYFQWFDAPYSVVNDRGSLSMNYKTAGWHCYYKIL